MTEQLQLPLEPSSEQPSEWTVTLSKGPLHAEVVDRTHTAKTPDNALALVEGLRDTFHGREDVAWQTEEPSADGVMYGLSPDGTVYVIRVTPALPRDL